MEKIAASIAQIAAEAQREAGIENRAPDKELPPSVMDGLKAWIADQDEPKPSVSDAVRQGLTQWLTGLGYLPASAGDSPPGRPPA